MAYNSAGCCQTGGLASQYGSYRARYRVVTLVSRFVALYDTLAVCTDGLSPALEAKVSLDCQVAMTLCIVLKLKQYLKVCWNARTILAVLIAYTIALRAISQFAFQLSKQRCAEFKPDAPIKVPHAGVGRLSVETHLVSSHTLGHRETSTR